MDAHCNLSYPNRRIIRTLRYLLGLSVMVLSCKAQSCPSYYIGDGECDSSCNFHSSNWDGGDCCPAYWISDGECDEKCNFASQDFDGGDCSTSCPSNWCGDDYCDSVCNTARYDYDCGDCKYGDGSACNYNGQCTSGVCRSSRCCGPKGKSMGCTSCDSNGYCSRCSSGYTLSNWQCFPSLKGDGDSCSSGSQCYSNVCRGSNCCNSKGRSTGCIDCDSDGDCWMCSSSYYRSSYECFPKRSDGSTCSASSTCMSGDCRGSNCCNDAGKSSGCIDCAINGDCSACSSSYYLSSGRCYQIKSDGAICDSGSQCRGSVCRQDRCCNSLGRRIGCISCGSNGSCNSVAPGYYLTSTGEPLSKKPDGNTCSSSEECFSGSCDEKCTSFASLRFPDVFYLTVPAYISWLGGVYKRQCGILVNGAPTWRSMESNKSMWFIKEFWMLGEEKSLGQDLGYLHNRGSFGTLQEPTYEHHKWAYWGGEKWIDDDIIKARDIGAFCMNLEYTETCNEDKPCNGPSNSGSLAFPEVHDCISFASRMFASSSNGYSWNCSKCYNNGSPRCSVPPFVGSTPVFFTRPGPNEFLPWKTRFPTLSFTASSERQVLVDNCDTDTLAIINGVCGYNGGFACRASAECADKACVQGICCSANGQSEGCFECLGANGDCSMCTSAYFLANGMCHQLKTDGETCASVSECASGVCHGNFCCGIKGRSVGCLACNSRGECATCAPGSYLANGRCNILLDSGATCDASFTCESGVCSGGHCCGYSGLLDGCTSCSSNGRCSACTAETHFLLAEKCELLVDVGEKCSFDAECKSGTCDIRGEFCCSTDCAECIRGVGGRIICLKCADSYFLSAGECVEDTPSCICHNGDPQNESSCTANRGRQCSQCDPGFKLASHGRTGYRTCTINPGATYDIIHCIYTLPAAATSNSNSNTLLRIYTHSSCQGKPPEKLPHCYWSNEGPTRNVCSDCKADADSCASSATDYNHFYNFVDGDSCIPEVPSGFVLIIANGVAVDDIPLDDLGANGCSAESPCSMCVGDCDSDAECADGLSCFQRKYTTMVVPGCSSGGRGDNAETDYCYRAPDSGLLPLRSASDGGHCSSSDPCSECQGDCDDDSECAEGLYCFARGGFKGSEEYADALVPGCKAGGKPTTDYCYNSTAVGHLWAISSIALYEEECTHRACTEMTLTNMISNPPTSNDPNTDPYKAVDGDTSTFWYGNPHSGYINMAGQQWIMFNPNGRPKVLHVEQLARVSALTVVVGEGGSRTYSSLSHQFKLDISRLNPQLLPDGAPCERNTECNSSKCMGSCCGRKGRSVGCTECNADGSCEICDENYNRVAYECFTGGLDTVEGCNAAFTPIVESDCPDDLSMFYISFLYPRCDSFALPYGGKCLSYGMCNTNANLDNCGSVSIYRKLKSSLSSTSCDKDICISDGSVVAPYCAGGPVNCTWDAKTKNICANALCEASGFRRGIFKSASNNMCTDSYTSKGGFVYITEYRSMTYEFYQNEAAITAQCTDNALVRDGGECIDSNDCQSGVCADGYCCGTKGKLHCSKCLQSTGNCGLCDDNYQLLIGECFPEVDKNEGNALNKNCRSDESCASGLCVCDDSGLCDSKVCGRRTPTGECNKDSFCLSNVCKAGFCCTAKGQTIGCVECGSNGVCTVCETGFNLVFDECVEIRDGPETNPSSTGECCKKGEKLSSDGYMPGTTVAYTPATGPCGFVISSSNDRMSTCKSYECVASGFDCELGYEWYTNPGFSGLSLGLVFLAAMFGALFHRRGFYIAKAMCMAMVTIYLFTSAYFICVGIDDFMSKDFYCCNCGSTQDQTDGKDPDNAYYCVSEHSDSCIPGYYGLFSAEPGNFQNTMNKVFMGLFYTLSLIVELAAWGLSMKYGYRDIRDGQLFYELQKKLNERKAAEKEEEHTEKTLDAFRTRRESISRSKSVTSRASLGDAADEAEYHEGEDYVNPEEEDLYLSVKQRMASAKKKSESTLIQEKNIKVDAKSKRDDAKERAAERCKVSFGKLVARLLAFGFILPVTILDLRGDCVFSDIDEVKVDIPTVLRVYIVVNIIFFVGVCLAIGGVLLNKYNERNEVEDNDTPMQLIRGGVAAGVVALVMSIGLAAMAVVLGDTFKPMNYTSLMLILWQVLEVNIGLMMNGIDWEHRYFFLWGAPLKVNYFIEPRIQVLMRKRATAKKQEQFSDTLENDIATVERNSSIRRASRRSQKRNKQTVTNPAYNASVEVYEDADEQFASSPTLSSSLIRKDSGTFGFGPAEKNSSRSSNNPESAHESKGISEAFDGFNVSEPIMENQQRDCVEHKEFIDLLRALFFAAGSESQETDVLSKHEVMYTIDLDGLERYSRVAGHFDSYDLRGNGQVDWRNWVAAANSDSTITCAEFCSVFASTPSEIISKRARQIEATRTVQKIPGSLADQLTGLFYAAEGNSGRPKTDDLRIGKSKLLWHLDTIAIEDALREAGTFSRFDRDFDGMIDWRHWVRGANTLNSDDISLTEFLCIFVVNPTENLISVQHQHPIGNRARAEAMDVNMERPGIEECTYQGVKTGKRCKNQPYASSSLCLAHTCPTCNDSKPSVVTQCTACANNATDKFAEMNKSWWGAQLNKTEISDKVMAGGEGAFMFKPSSKPNTVVLYVCDGVVVSRFPIEMASDGLGPCLFGGSEYAELDELVSQLQIRTFTGKNGPIKLGSTPAAGGQPVPNYVILGESDMYSTMSRNESDMFGGLRRREDSFSGFADTGDDDL